MKPTAFFRASFLSALLVAAAPASAQTAVATKGQVVAFGLSDDQDVFHSEATRAAAILARHYGNGAAPLIYTNTPSARRANLANLHAALAKAAARMDRDNDVLFLFLTSHGSPHGIQVKAGRREAVLTPAQVAELLRESGVRNKVLIVSACYSGIFIPLAGPGTLVVTAADAMHPSFGCQNKAKWTYFGRAYFEAVARTDNLHDAFVLARATVTSRERKEGFEPSNPQMAGGEAFVARLHAAR